MDLLNRIIHYRPGRLAKNASLSLFWQGSRLGLLAAWGVVVARVLGPENYGTYSGVAGIAVILGGLTGLGLGLVMYQDSARTPSQFSAKWTNALITIFVSAVVFLPAFLLAGHFFLEQNTLSLLLAIGISEIAFFPFLTTSAFAFAAHERIGWASALPTIMAALRLIAVLVFWWLCEARDLGEYVWFHTTATIIGAFLSISAVYRILKPNRKEPFKLSIKEIKDGLVFSASWASSNALTSLDKTFAFYFGSAEISGIYSAVCRVFSILTQPIDALVSAAMPRLFTPKGHHALIIRLIIAVLLYGLLIGCLSWPIIKLIPFIFGQAFLVPEKSSGYLMLLPLCYGMRFLACNLLIGQGKKHLKITIELTGICLLLLLSALLVPLYGLNGAIYSLVSTEMYLAAAGFMTLSIARKLWK